MTAVSSHHPKNRRIFSLFMLAVAAVSVLGLFVPSAPALAAPRLANYYLGTLPTDADSINTLAQNDVLILTPDQGVIRRDVIDKLRAKNPELILFAYVPNKSYPLNWKEYPASTIYGDYQVDPTCWLKDSKGNIQSDWVGVKNLNMAEHCSDYLIDYVKSHVLSQGIWDGIFWDVVGDTISWTNGGDIDLDLNGVKDNPKTADAMWLSRIQYLFEQSRINFDVKYIIMNGSSAAALQEHVNGRMYESYPTPWEANGSWAALMSSLAKNRDLNTRPQLYVFNANTNNTGNKNDYRAMRFGLSSSLLLDNSYFSFDFGTNDHAQIWTYDEYKVNLGDPAADAVSQNSTPRFKEDVWQREYANGITLVNPTSKAQTIDLGQDYEKIIGTQDKKINDGSIVDRVTIGPKDGLIMLKTLDSTQPLKNTVFNNGTFLRFFDFKGNRARNGFFTFEDQFAGGAAIYHGDLDADGQEETIVATGAKLEIFNAGGDRWFNDYPYGANFKGSIQIAVGRLFGGAESQIVVAPSTGGKVIVYDYHGQVVKDNFYPLGNKYKDGFTVAIGNRPNGQAGELLIGTKGAKAAEILVFTDKLDKPKVRFFPYDKKYTGGVRVVEGDINGDGKYEIITLPLKGTQTMRLLSTAGKKISEFKIGNLFGSQPTGLTISDINKDGQQDIVVMNGQ